MTLPYIHHIPRKQVSMQKRPIGRTRSTKYFIEAWGLWYIGQCHDKGLSFEGLFFDMYEPFRSSLSKAGPVDLGM